MEIADIFIQKAAVTNPSLDNSFCEINFFALMDWNKPVIEQGKLKIGKAKVQSANMDNMNETVRPGIFICLLCNKLVESNKKVNAT